MFNYTDAQWRADTISSTATSDAIPHADRWRVTVASDWAPRFEYEPVMLADPAAVYGDLLPLFEASDLNIVNVEAVLGNGDVGQPIAKAGPHLKGDPRSVAALTRAKFHVGCLANNHIMDFGPDGLRQTRRVLDDAGIQSVGAGEDAEQIEQPLLITVQGVKVAIINCAEGESGRSVYGEPGVYGLDVPKVAQQIATLKQTGQAQVVIVIFHGGREYVPVAPPYIVRTLRQVADAGADAVIAHHPHVPQAVEIHHAPHHPVPIAYSQGNFVFWQQRDEIYRRIGYLVHLDFQGQTLAGCSLTPYLLTPEGLTAMPAEQRTWFLSRLAEAAKPLKSMDTIRATWSAFADRYGIENAMANLARVSGNITEQTDLAKSAAHLKNLFFTPAHAEMHIELLDRMMRGTYGTAPTWARDLVQEWMHETKNI